MPMPRFFPARVLSVDPPFTLSDDRLATIVHHSRTDGARVADSFRLQQHQPRVSRLADASSRYVSPMPSIERTDEVDDS
jgi:hypothetical protein